MSCVEVVSPMTIDFSLPSKMSYTPQWPTSADPSSSSVQPSSTRSAAIFAKKRLSLTKPVSSPHSYISFPLTASPVPSHHHQSSPYPSQAHPPPHRQRLSLSTRVPPSTPPRPPAMRTASEIMPRLYISDLSFAESAACLAAYGITHVLSVLPDPIVIPHQPSPSGPPTKRLQVKLEDFPFAELAAHLPTTTAFIRDALYGSTSSLGSTSSSRAPPSAATAVSLPPSPSHCPSGSGAGETRVLVHCAEGISRSVSVVAAFLIAQYGWTPSEAVRFVKSRRAVADPNFGFIQQLGEYARSLAVAGPGGAHTGAGTGLISPSSPSVTGYGHAPW